MKISIQSINRYLKKPLTTDQIVQILGRTEIEVDEVIKTEPWDQKIVVGKVITLSPHPQADRLRLATVDIGALSKQPVQVVCGAPNIALGQLVALALAGATLPDGTKITTTTIRGQRSNGMLCSARELGISDDHSGILVLDHPALPGQILCDVWQIHDVLDIKTHPNRWDHQSWVGVAREISAASDDPSNLLIEPNPPENQYSKTISHNVKKTGKCGRFITVKLRVKNDVKTPTWVVENLRANGLRSINAVVDITNFVMLEFGQPSHAYDAAKIRGDLRVSFGSPAQTLTTIDGVSRQLAASDLIIADDSGPVGLAGVIGGQSSEIDVTTREIILEVAQFDKTTVRRAALRHGLRTEASARFERGLPFRLPLLAADRLIELLSEICDAELLASPIDFQESEIVEKPKLLGLRVRRAEQLLGMKVDEKQVITGLKRLGLEVEHFSLSRLAQQLAHDPKSAIFASMKAKNPNLASLTNHIYQRIGLDIGSTMTEQLKNGQAVDENSNNIGFRPGDILFAGDIKKPKIGLYIGKNKLLTLQTTSTTKPIIKLVPISDLVNDSSFRGGRRYVDSFNHILAITVPWWRTDLEQEEDIVEEIAKIIGYDQLPTTLPQLPPQDTTEHQVLPQTILFKQQLVALGLFEVMTYSFVGQQDIALTGVAATEHLSVANPLSREQAYLRSSFLPSHLAALQKNMRYPQPFGWFEIAKLFRHQPQSKTVPVAETWRLGILFVGENSLDRTKNVINWLVQRSHEPYAIVPQQGDWFIDGRAATLSNKGTAFGRFGQLLPDLLPKKMSNVVVSYAEIDLLPILQSQLVEAKPAPAYQLIERDISLEIDDTILWQNVAKLMHGHPHIYQIRSMGEYRESDSAARRTLTVRLLLDCGVRPTTGQIQKLLDEVTHTFVSKLHATIR